MILNKEEFKRQRDKRLLWKHRWWGREQHGHRRERSCQWWQKYAKSVCSFFVPFADHVPGTDRAGDGGRSRSGDAIGGNDE